MVAVHPHAKGSARPWRRALEQVRAIGTAEQDALPLRARQCAGGREKLATGESKLCVFLFVTMCGSWCFGADVRSVFQFDPICIHTSGSRVRRCPTAINLEPV